MIEFLEPRIAPAGLIDVTFSHGHLLLKALTGNAGDETATITRSGDSRITITPGANVAIRFEGITFPPAEPLVLDGFSGKLTVKLGGGNDALTLDGGTYPGNVLIDLGTGANQFTLTGADFHTAKSLTVKSGSGNDQLIFKSTKLVVENSLTIASGAGSDTVQFTPDIAELSVGKNLTVSALGSRSALSEQSITGLGKIDIGGTLKLSAGTGDRVQQVLTGTIGTLSIGGNTTFSATDPTEHTQVLAGNNLALGGTLHITSRALSAVQTLSAAAGSITEAVTLTGGTAVLVDFSGALSSNLAITTAKNHSASVALSAADISGSVRIAMRDSFGLAASITVQDVVIHGALAITGGIGATTLKVNQADIAKTFTVALKDGTNSFLIEQENQPGASFFRGNVKLTGGIDVDTFALGETGNNAIQFLATVIANGRAGTDLLTEGDASTHPAGLSTVKINIP